jgi:hypothetical protein
MDEKRPVASHVVVKTCVSMEKSREFAVYVLEVLSVRKNVQIKANKRTAVQDVEVASSVKIVFLLLSVEDASSVHPAYQLPFEAREMRRPSLLLSSTSGLKRVKFPTSLHGTSKISLQTLCNAASTGLILHLRCRLG